LGVRRQLRGYNGKDFGSEVISKGLEALGRNHTEDEEKVGFA
jgi:hypothetical protein